MDEASPRARALSDQECWELLERHRIGRLAFHLVDEVHITPLNYLALNRRQLVFQSSPGSKLLAIEMDPSVAFEIDEIGTDVALSVVVRGRARQAEGREATELNDLPWNYLIQRHRPVPVVIEVDTLSGREFPLVAG